MSTNDKLREALESTAEALRGVEYEQIRGLMMDAAKALAAPTPPAQPEAVLVPLTEAWQPIETAPKDGTAHIRGLHVHNSAGDFIYWDCNAGRINDETGEFEDLGGEHTGWDADDYTHWMPLPAAPKQEK